MIWPKIPTESRLQNLALKHNSNWAAFVSFISISMTFRKCLPQARCYASIMRRVRTIRTHFLSSKNWNFPFICGRHTSLLKESACRQEKLIYAWLSFFDHSFFIHYSSLKPYELELIVRPLLCRSYGLSGSVLFIHIEDIPFQNSLPNLAEMTLSNCVSIRFFRQFTILAKQWSISSMTVMETPNSLFHETFLFPYQLSRHRLNRQTRLRTVSTKHIHAQVCLDSDWLHGYGFPDACSRKVSWDEITECLN